MYTSWSRRYWKKPILDDQPSLDRYKLLTYLCLVYSLCTEFSKLGSNDQYSEAYENDGSSVSQIEQSANGERHLACW